MYYIVRGKTKILEALFIFATYFKMEPFIILKDKKNFHFKKNNLTQNVL